MKNLIMVLVALVFVSGCALYGNEAQYNKGDWYGVAGSQEVSNIQRDKHALIVEKNHDQMVLDKLMSQSVKTKIENNVVQGYGGIVNNLSQERVNMVIRCGSEIKSYFLDPMSQVDDNLLPNKKCHVMTYLGNTPADKGVFFSVGVEQYQYRGKMVHWYVYYDPDRR